MTVAAVASEAAAAAAAKPKVADELRVGVKFTGPNEEQRYEVINLYKKFVNENNREHLVYLGTCWHLIEIRASLLPF